MRGKGPAATGLKQYEGITPAHAGKRLVSGLRFFSAKDHPRPCGEKLYAGTGYGRSVGSPPPMRGKVSHIRDKIKSKRITPAHAGKSQYLGTAFSHEEDHPRPCGEKTGARWRGGWRAGSPPPMRGKVAIYRASGSPARITPAHAGKSHLKAASYRGQEDHPRPCGEKKPQ